MKTENKFFDGFIVGLSLGISITIMILLFSCSKPDTVCYECWSSTGIHEIFDNTTPETMQHTIDWWAENGIELKCKQIAP